MPGWFWRGTAACVRAKAVATLLAAVALAALAVAVAAPAAAQEAKPTPTSCAGMAFTDPAGDATAAAAKNLDITAGFLRYGTNSMGENVLTANIQMSNLSESSEVGSYASEWMFSWTSGNTRQYVGAEWFSSTSPVSPGEVVYRYGIEGDDRSKRTTGRMFLGKDGIVEIVVPVDRLDLAGKRLTDPRAVSQIYYSEGLNVYPPVVADRAPDSQAGGKAFDVVPCAQENTPTTAQPTTPAGQPSGTGPATLDVEVIVGRLSARRISKRRTLSIRLRAGETTTALRLRLQRGKKVVATGSLALLSETGTAKLKLKAVKRKLEAGTYTLRLTGRNASGRVASGLVQVRIRR